VRILFLSSWFPYPTNNGSKIRVYNLLRGLSQCHKITLLSFSDQTEVPSTSSILDSFCSEIHVVPWKQFRPDSLKARLGFLNSAPRSISDTFSQEMTKNIQELLSTQEYDLLIAQALGTASYSRYFHGIPALFEEVELGLPFERFVNADSPWQRFRYGLTWAKHRHYLAQLLQYYAACTVVSEREQQLLSQSVPGYNTIEVIPNCINLADYEHIRRTPEPNCLIFTGSFRYSANYDAMVWFLQEIYPRIQNQVPDVHLTITGDHANLSLPHAKDVKLTGFVDDVRPLIASASISLAPIRVGGGTRLKILEAMALRTPVVSTTKGAEGLDVQSGKNILLADTPDNLSEMVILLLKDPELRQQIVDNAFSLVSEKYNWAIVMPRLLNLIERIKKP
jgi:glycosyltransferase involved in cell wall biosynthesis